MFALGVYAQQEAKGEDFYDSYKALLRDTGGPTMLYVGKIAI